MSGRIVYIFIASILLLINNRLVAQEEIVLTGVYKGDPLYIQNPYHPGLKNFCINSIKVNEKLLEVDYKLSAIKLNFSEFDLYTPVKITINHKNICKPVIVNKQAILFHSSFKFTDMVLTDSVMTWSTKGDRQDAVFQIEKLYSNGWSLIETVEAKGQFKGAEYQYIPELEEGANKYRIKYKINEDRYLYSSEVELEFYPDPVQLISAVVSTTVRFSRVSEFRIEDKTGETILTGNGKSIDIRHLKAGEYYIFFDDNPIYFLKDAGN
ncbi:MAG: hypothetical protein WBA74_16010 [Cyclobacteriaceae bacterium]